MHTCKLLGLAPVFLFTRFFVCSFVHQPFPPNKSLFRVHGGGLWFQISTVLGPFGPFPRVFECFAHKGCAPRLLLKASTARISLFLATKQKHGLALTNQVITSSDHRDQTASISSHRSSMRSPQAREPRFVQAAVCPCCGECVLRTSVKMPVLPAYHK